MILPKRWGAALLALTLAGCVAPNDPGAELGYNLPRDRPPATRPPSRQSSHVPARPSGPASNALNLQGSARLAGVRAGPDLASLNLSDDSARAALAAFRLSCPALLRRADGSGLTRGADWQAACGAAMGWPERDARRFFAEQFESAIVGDGAAFATGYYEPEIAASLTRAPGYTVPIYRKPPDLVEADLGLFSDDWKGKRIRGRIADGRLVPYADRAAIEGGALAGQSLEIAWAADQIGRAHV